MSVEKKLFVRGAGGACELHLHFTETEEHINHGVAIPKAHGIRMIPLSGDVPVVGHDMEMDLDTTHFHLKGKVTHEGDIVVFHEPCGGKRVFPADQCVVYRPREHTVHYGCKGPSEALVICTLEDAVLLNTTVRLSNLEIEKNFMTADVNVISTFAFPFDSVDVDKVVVRRQESGYARPIAMRGAAMMAESSGGGSSGDEPSLAPDVELLGISNLGRKPQVLTEQTMNSKLVVFVNANWRSEPELVMYGKLPVSELPPSSVTTLHGTTPLAQTTLELGFNPEDTHAINLGSMSGLINMTNANRDRRGEITGYDVRMHNNTGTAVVMDIFGEGPGILDGAYADLDITFIAEMRPSDGIKDTPLYKSGFKSVWTSRVKVDPHSSVMFSVKK